MSYLVLARKFRPQDFSTVAGQEHVTRTLANSIKRSKVHHAYLFCGPRGVGKTSIARILSKALNCEKGPTPTPCLTCTNCREITEGRSLAVREIDGASHNSVDNVREVIETLRSLPAPGSRYKIYIIDEVHMLSTAAFNALLKSLEEPPPNTVFILATTEVHKIPETVLSRCQRHDFRSLPAQVIAARLEEMSAAEKIKVDPEAFRMVARLADGSMRDAQSLLDRVFAYGGDSVSAKDAGEALGVVDGEKLFTLSQAILKRQSADALRVISDIFASGSDPRIFLNDFVSHWRDLLLARFGGKAALTEAGIPDEIAAQLLEQSALVSGPDLQDLIHIGREGADTAMRSAFPRYLVEALVVRMATREPVEDIARLIARSGATLSAPASATKAAPRAVPANTPASTLPPTSSRAPVSASPVQSPPVVQSANGSALDWKRFVASASDSGSKMLGEYLKRVAVEHFAAGQLRGSGPKISIDYLNDPQNKERLLGLLAKLGVAPSWDVKLTQSDGSSPAESILQGEKNQIVSEKMAEIRNAEAHPAVQNLKKAFPGTTLKVANKGRA